MSLRSHIALSLLVFSFSTSGFAAECISKNDAVEKAATLFYCEYFGAVNSNHFEAVMPIFGEKAWDESKEEVKRLFLSDEYEFSDAEKAHKFTSLHVFGSYAERATVAVDCAGNISTRVLTEHD